MYSYHVKALPTIFDSYFLPIAEAHNYNARSKSNQNYFLNFVNSNSGKNSIKFYVQLSMETPILLVTFVVAVDLVSSALSLLSPVCLFFVL